MSIKKGQSEPFFEYFPYLNDDKLLDGCFTHATDYFGDDIKGAYSGGVKSPEECQKRCQVQCNEMVLLPKLM